MCGGIKKEKHTIARFLIWGAEILLPPYEIKMSQIQEFLLVTQLPSFKEILTYTVGMPKAKDDQNADTDKPRRKPRKKKAKKKDKGPGTQRPEP